MTGNTMTELVTRILDGTAPLPAKEAAARGVLPILPLDLIRIFVFLLQDENERIRKDAAASIAKLKEETLAEVLGSDQCAPDVLTYFSRTATDDGKEVLAARIASNRSAPTEALEILAGSTDQKILTLVLTNQERLLDTPELMDRLLANTALRPEQRSWIGETLDRARRRDEGKEEPAEIEEAEEIEKAEDEDITIEDVARILNVDIGELMTASEIAGGEEFQQSDVPEIVRNAYQKIMTLNTSQKAILALKGGREERAILIRDTNRLVALAVMKNPRLPDGEVEAIAAMRNVREDVLRAIGCNREWTKNYVVILALIRNPRTPPGISTNFISRLQNRDLKFLTKDKNVPELVRRMAKKNHDLRQQRSKVSFKKH